MEPFVSRLESAISPVLNAENVELVDLTYQKEGGRWILRVYLDKPGGFNLADCEIWSGRIGQILDEGNLIQNPYNLEISSPGIYRALKKLTDFQKFSGQRVKIKLFGPIEGSRNFSGFIEGTDDNHVFVRVEGNRRLEISLKQIAKANLDPVVDF